MNRPVSTLLNGLEVIEARIDRILSPAAFWRDLDEKTLAASVSETEVAEIPAGEPRTIVDLLIASGLVDSRGAARRTISEGGAYVNNERITADDWEPSESDLLHGQWLVLRKGKKNFAGVKIK